MERKKPILYIHGGSHKTGTKTIQYFLSQNSENLLKDSVLYPSTGRDELMQHHYLMSSLRVPEHPFFKPRKNYQDYIAELDDEIQRKNPRKVIISSEIFCELIKKDNVVFMKELQILFSLFSSVFVLFYVRRPDLYAISENNTFIWYGMRQEHKMNFLSFSNWIDFLPKNQLIFRPFEKGQFHDSDLISDFLKITKIEKNENFSYSDRKINESIDNDVLELCRIINKSIPELSAIPNFKREIIKALPKQKKPDSSFFSPRQQIDFYEKHSAVCEKIAREFLGREDGQLFYEPLPDPDAPWELYKGLPAETVVKAFSYLIFKLQKENNEIGQRITNIEKQIELDKKRHFNILPYLNLFRSKNS